MQVYICIFKQSNYLKCNDSDDDYGGGNNNNNNNNNNKVNLTRILY